MALSRTLLSMAWTRSVENCSVFIVFARRIIFFMRNLLFVPTIHLFILLHLLVKVAVLVLHHFMMLGYAPRIIFILQKNGFRLCRLVFEVSRMMNSLCGVLLLKF